MHVNDCLIPDGASWGLLLYQPTSGAPLRTQAYSETVQVKNRAKNRIGEDRIPQGTRRFFVAHKRDAQRPKDENSKDYPHPNHVRSLAQCDVQNVSGCLSSARLQIVPHGGSGSPPAALALPEISIVQRINSAFVFPKLSDSWAAGAAFF
jgi:hypothetical protein